MSKREVFRDFIKLYRKKEILWNRDSRNFHNIALKRKAYKELVNQLKVLKPDVDESYVKHRINIFRKNFFRELKKVEESIEKDTEIYQPKIWYYNDCIFLSRKEILIGNEKIPITDDPLCSPAFLKEFISIYKKNECLWNVKIPEYTNKEVKLKAYEELRQLMLKIDKFSTIVTVKKKIRSIRVNFKYRIRSYIETPKSHYINDLMFLKDQYLNAKLNIEPESSNRVSDSENDNSLFRPEEISIKNEKCYDKSVETVNQSGIFYINKCNNNQVDVVKHEQLLPSEEICIKTEEFDDNQILIINQPITDQADLDIIDLCDDNEKGVVVSELDNEMLLLPSEEICIKEEKFNDNQIEVINQPVIDQPRLDIIDLCDDNEKDVEVSGLHNETLLPSNEISLKEEKLSDNLMEVISQPIIDQPGLDIIDLCDDNKKEVKMPELHNETLLPSKETCTEEEKCDDYQIKVIKPINEQADFDDCEEALNKFQIKTAKPENREGCTIILVTQPYINWTKPVSNKRKRIETENEKKDNLSDLKETTVKNIEQNKAVSEPNEDGTEDAYAKYIANEMKCLSSTDRMCMKKLIHNAFLEAKLGNAEKLKLTTGKGTKMIVFDHSNNEI